MLGKRSLWGIGSVVVLLILFTTCFTRLHFSMRIYNGTDFFEFYQAVRFYFAGQDIYSPIYFQPLALGITPPLSHGHTSVIWANENLNPPFFILLLLPFYYFNYAHALILWGHITSLFAIGSLLVLAHQLSCPRSWTGWMAVSAAFFLSVPVSMNFADSQLGMLALWLSVMLWAAARARRDHWAGLWLGCACNIKLFFGLFFIYFLLLRRWRLLTIAVLSYVIGCVLAWYYFGTTAYLRYHHILQEIHWYTDNWNASFYGEFKRWFSHQEGNYAVWHLPWLATLLTVISDALVLGYIVYSLRRLLTVTDAQQRRDLEDTGFALILVSMLLLSPLGWSYYFSVLLLPFLMIMQQASYYSQGWIVKLMALCFLFMANLTGDLQHAYEMTTFKQILFDAGYGFYSLLGILGLLIYLYQRRWHAQPEVLPVKPVISEALWLGMYSLALAPAAISLLYLWRNMLLFSVTGGVSGSGV